MKGKQFVKLARAAVLAALLSCGATTALAQVETDKTAKESRITLKRGRASATVKGSVAWGRSDSHKLAAREGQKLTLKLASSNTQVLFALFAPDGKIFLDAVAAREWSGELPQKGDYTITVVNNEEDSPASPYTLEVKLK
ncbi:MAG TPA: hypothetical protein VEX60_09970 [Pyrinomonadaceae bacterium]|nr:hypothetical protein [Pyrinomonadaceae bacterium]